MSRIYWDTMLFVYCILLKLSPTRSAYCGWFSNQQRGARLLTGAFTLGEILA